MYQLLHAVKDESIETDASGSEMEMRLFLTRFILIGNIDPLYGFNTV